MMETRARLDKWLWAARFYKTRGLAAEEIGRGRVAVNDQVAKASRDLKEGDVVSFPQGPLRRTVKVLLTGTMRGPASVAQTMYEESAASLAAREHAAEARRLGVEPAQGIEHGRPTKRDRRQLADWQRWSASADSVPRKGGGSV
ncbi:MAG: RNA-binding S4 domain-containing protein [Pseudomonadota bacterium]|nr:RNA-binding S4 domain-containing protein [Pseudomonadota bacterium]